MTLSLQIKLDCVKIDVKRPMMSLKTPIFDILSISSRIQMCVSFIFYIDTNKQPTVNQNGIFDICIQVYVFHYVFKYGAFVDRISHVFIFLKYVKIERMLNPRKQSLSILKTWEDLKMLIMRDKL